MISFMLVMIWFFGGIASIFYFRLSDYFKNINNYDIWFLINIFIGLPLGMLSWLGLIIMYIFNKAKT